MRLVTQHVSARPFGECIIRVKKMRADNKQLTYVCVHISITSEIYSIDRLDALFEAAQKEKKEKKETTNTANQAANL